MSALRMTLFSPTSFVVGTGTVELKPWSNNKKKIYVKLFRSSRLLISTEAAGMGNDQGDIDLVVVLGVDSTEWKAAQKVGLEVKGLGKKFINVVWFLLLSQPAIYIS